MRLPRPNTVRLRPATDADAPAISDVYLAARQLLAYAPLAHVEVDVRQWIATTLIPGGGVWVAVAHDTIVGMLAISDDGKTRWIDQLYVHPDAVGRGIGTQLVRHALAILAPPIQLYSYQNHSEIVHSSSEK